LPILTKRKAGRERKDPRKPVGGREGPLGLIRGEKCCQPRQRKKGVFTKTRKKGNAPQNPKLGEKQQRQKKKILKEGFWKKKEAIQLEKKKMLKSKKLRGKTGGRK